MPDLNAIHSRLFTKQEAGDGPKKMNAAQVAHQAPLVKTDPAKPETPKPPVKQNAPKTKLIDKLAEKLNISELEDYFNEVDDDEVPSALTKTQGAKP